jgi:hypothetical protein
MTEMEIMTIMERQVSFKLPSILFQVTIKFPLGDNKKFFTMEKSRIEQFPINNNLATTGHVK